MLALFDECAAREAERRRLGRLAVFIVACADTVRHGFAVRAAERRDKRQSRHQFDLALHGAGPRPRGPRMTTLLTDIKYALRVLTKDRSFTATVLLTLAICVAASAAIFAVVQSVLLRPLPVNHAEKLVTIMNSYPNAGAPRASNGVPDYYDRLEGVSAVDELALYRSASAAFGFDAGAERLLGMQSTPSLLRMLQVQPALGRIFTEADGEPGNNLKAIL